MPLMGDVENLTWLFLDGAIGLVACGVGSLLLKMMSFETSPPRLSNPTLILSNQANFKYAINAYKTKIRAQVTLSYDHEGNGGQLRRFALENA